MSIHRDIRQAVVRLQRTAGDKTEGLKRGISRLARATLANAQEMCPRDSGYLADSGSASDATASSRVIRSEVAFNANYALAVHEGLNKQFNTAQNPLAQAKYLETAVNQIAPKAESVLAQEVERS